MAIMTVGDLVPQARPGFKALPPGEYDAVVSAVGFKEATKGDPMFKVEFTIVGGEFDGRKRWRDITVTARSGNIAVDQLGILNAVIGEVALALKDSSDEAEVRRIARELMDVPCSIKTSRSLFRGEADRRGGDRTSRATSPLRARREFAERGLT